MRNRLATTLTALGLITAVAATAACTSTPDAPPPEAAPSAPADLSAGRSDPVADPLYPDHGNPAIDVLHYGLAFSYNPDTTVLDGRATLTIRPTVDATELRLDLASTMAVSNTTVDGVKATAVQDGDHVAVAATVRKDQNVVLLVEYSGTPRQAPAPASRKDMTGGVGMRVEADGSLWTMQEPYGAFTWYPVNDQPSDEALYDIAVSTPGAWVGVATGTYLGKHDGGSGYATTSWQSLDPVAGYVTTLAVDRFTEIDGGTDANGVRIVSWLPEAAPPSWRDAIDRIPAHLAWLEKRYGPYPFATAGVVLVGGQSAMETQGLVTASVGLATLGPDQTDRVVVHELSHQWFGDAVTPVDWRGVWLNEGMATYTESMYAVDKGLLTETEAVRVWRDADQSLRDQFGPPGAYDPADFASRNVYFCTALMLYELRVRMGGDRFDTLLRDWGQQRNTHQDRASFTAWVNRYAGADLTSFIDEWLDAKTTPTR